MDVRPLSSLSSSSASDLTWRVLIYSLAGAGKTCFAASFPKPLFFFDFDQKLRAIQGVIDTKDIDFVSYPYAEPRECSVAWRKFLKDFKEIKTDTKYKTIVLDSLTYMDKLLRVHTLIANGKAPEERLQIQHYGEIKDNYEFLLMEFNKIPGKNILLLAHESPNYDKEGDILLDISPLITGEKIKSELPALFEEVYYLERKGGPEDKRVLYYKPHKKYIANSILLHGSGVIEVPTYESLVAESKKGLVK